MAWYAHAGLTLNLTSDLAGSEAQTQRLTKRYYRARIYDTLTWLKLDILRKYKKKVDFSLLQMRVM